MITIVGARPQFIKAAAVSPLLRQAAVEVIVHTGQHYDSNMSDVFFRELELAEPDYNLGIGSGTHGAQTGRMLEAVERVMVEEKPDWVLVYGDTNSTLAGALAAAKLGIPVAHVEAGLRSFNMEMPEEINRVVTDHLSRLLFAPTKTAMGNLAREGLAKRAILVGDVMADILFRIRPRLRNAHERLHGWGVQAGNYVLLTLHRPSNVDDAERLHSIIGDIARIEEPVLFPVHPRTRDRIRQFGLEGIVGCPPFRCVAPLGYHEMLIAEANARVVVTDSGGVQKEAYLLSVPCVTLRQETEWVETVETGWNRLVGTVGDALVTAIQERHMLDDHPDIFGDGHAAERVVCALTSGC